MPLPIGESQVSRLARASLDESLQRLFQEVLSGKTSLEQFNRAASIPFKLFREEYSRILALSVSLSLYVYVSCDSQCV